MLFVCSPTHPLSRFHSTHPRCQGFRENQSTKPASKLFPGEFPMSAMERLSQGRQRRAWVLISTLQAVPYSSKEDELLTSRWYRNQQEPSNRAATFPGPQMPLSGTVDFLLPGPKAPHTLEGNEQERAGQARNWGTDVENKRMDTKGGKQRGWVGGAVVWWTGRVELTYIH